MLDVDPQNVFEVAATEDQQPVETFVADGPDESLRVGFACGACTGVWMTLMPSLRNTSSKGAVNLLSRSWIRKRIRSINATGKVDAPAPELDEEEHIETTQRDRLDREEVAGEQARA